MARPERNDVDYFPFYAKDGRTLFILESKYGCEGTGFFTNVLRFLALIPGHHFCIAEDSDRLFFFSKTKCSEEKGNDMLNIMSTTGKIDRKLWEEKEVIASQSFLDSIEDAYRLRKTPIIKMAEIYLKYSVSTEVIPHKGRVSTVETRQNNVDKPQTILKESKVKKTREREKTARKFKKPMVEEIRAYCKERKNNIDAQLFYDHYEARG